MTGASEDLLQAVLGLRKAAEAQFTGNAYYQVANQINDLIESLGWEAGGIAPGKGAAYGFASMLAEVRKLAEASTSGNEFYIIGHKLDLLAAYLSPSAKETEKAGAVSEKRAAAIAANLVAAASASVPAQPPAAAPVTARPTFAELAAASKARVEEVASSLGIATAHPAPQAEAEAKLFEGELERRSSEPCAMAELAPVTLEPVAAAAILAEAVAAPLPAGTTISLGSPAAEAGHVAVQGAASAAAEEKAAGPAVELSAPAHDSLAAAAGQKIAEKTPAERRLESRSSEAAPQTLEPVEPAAIPAEAAAGPSPAETAAHLGSPAAQSEAFAVEETAAVEIVAAEIAVEPAVQVSAPVKEAPAPSAGHKAEVKKPDEAKRKEPKTLFRLWLDLAFGRKN